MSEPRVCLESARNMWPDVQRTSAHCWNKPDICETNEQSARIAGLSVAYADVVSHRDNDVGWTEVVKHSNPFLDSTQQIRQTTRRFGAEKDQEVEWQVVDLIQRDIVEHPIRAWRFLVMLVRKKDRSWRICVDYRSLNAVTRKDAYPLPQIDDSLNALLDSVLFCTLDLVSGNWQVLLDQDAKEKSAVMTQGVR